MWQVGRTKLFLKDAQYNRLETERNLQLEAKVVRLQSWWRCVWTRSYFKSYKKMTILAQSGTDIFLPLYIEVCSGFGIFHISVVRGFLARRLYQRLLEEERRRKWEAEQKRIREEEERRRREEEERQRIEAERRAQLEREKEARRLERERQEEEMRQRGEVPLPTFEFTEPEPEPELEPAPPERQPEEDENRPLPVNIYSLPSLNTHNALSKAHI